MINGLVGGLFAAWILTGFDVHDILIEAIQPMFPMIEITKNHYYLVFAVVGMVGGLFNKFQENYYMKKIIGNILIYFGYACCLYVGGWLMFIQPIIQACQTFDAGTLTGSIIGITIAKCLFSGLFGGLALPGVVIGAVIANM